MTDDAVTPPGATDARVDTYIDALPAWQQEICHEVRRLVHEADPEVVETIKRTRQPYFVLQGNVCALLAARTHVNVFLYDGAIVPDPAGIITGGHANTTARTVAVREGETIDAAALVAMFRQIIANNRAGGWRRIKAGRPSTMIDVTHQINAVARTVGARTLDAGQARVVTISQTYPADVDDLWDACTVPERIPRWFLPVSGELRLGGRYQLEGHAGGTIERCDPPHSFAATWEFGGELSWIEVRVAPAEGGARFTIEHTAHVDDERWAEFGPGAVGVGFDGALLGMALHLESGRAVDAAAVMAWMSEPDGVRFLTDASEAWRAAHVAAGADAADARAAADRTTAAYTATPS